MDGWLVSSCCSLHRPHGPNSEVIGFGVTSPRPWGRGHRETYLVLDVGIDPFQHPCTGIFIGQIWVYLWKRWATPKLSIRTGWYSAQKANQLSTRPLYQRILCVPKETPRDVGLDPHGLVLRLHLHPGLISLCCPIPLPLQCLLGVNYP